MVPPWYPHGHLLCKPGTGLCTGHACMRQFPKRPPGDAIGRTHHTLVLHHCMNTMYLCDPERVETCPVAGQTGGHVLLGKLGRWRCGHIDRLRHARVLPACMGGNESWRAVHGERRLLHGAPLAAPGRACGAGIILLSLLSPGRVCGPVVPGSLTFHTAGPRCGRQTPRM